MLDTDYGMYHGYEVEHDKNRACGMRDHYIGQTHKEGGPMIQPLPWPPVPPIDGSHEYFPPKTSCGCHHKPGMCDCHTSGMCCCPPMHGCCCPPMMDCCPPTTIPGMVCPTVCECPVERCIQRNIIHCVPHVQPIHTRIVNNHIYKHSCRPCFTCCEENTCTSICEPCCDPCCCNPCC